MKIAALAASLLAAPMLLIEPVCAQDAATGERLFRQRCASCHTVQPGQNRIGPHLSGIVGRKPGSVEGVRYSKGLSAIEPNWDAASLDAYLANPRGVAPGTTMSVSVPNAADRGSIVAYLQGLTAAN
ncbi:membrane c-type cytochrome cy [Hyphomicrobiales bacterium]|jgi:cytochrome c|nr:membrane c-type cytochrome cy [Hyphomicrobiales bacterium]CAH1702132.1 membrane c-type cytochrome cy [Hyphomicrobiales bacterium]CAI0346338.1 cytochrome c [Hyphomicrobiales bacterium]